MRKVNIVLICKVNVCDRDAVKRGWCNRHYRRWLEHGDPGDDPIGKPGRARFTPYAEFDMPVPTYPSSEYCAGCGLSFSHWPGCTTRRRLRVA